MKGRERDETQERREREFRQWNHDELAAETALLERKLLISLFKLSGDRSDVVSEEVAEAYRDGELKEYLANV